MKMNKVVMGLILLITLSGLFMNWAQIQFKAVTGLSHWSGIMILLVGSISFFLLLQERSHKVNFLLIALIPLLAFIQFLSLGPIMNISGRDFWFSLDVVQIGFFVTLIGGLLYLFLYSIYYFKKTTLVEQHVFTKNNELHREMKRG